MADGESLKVEVAWATPERQVVLRVALPAGATVEQAVRRSGILEVCPDAEFDPQRLGIYGRKVTPDETVRDGDRVELYRPLIADPRDARRARVEKDRGR